MADDDLLTEAKEAFELASNTEHENRDAARDDLRFGRLGQQWPQEIQRIRKDRPTLTINKMPAFIRQVTNDARQMRPQMRVYPVDSNADVDTANVLGGLVRSIEQQSNADLAYDTAGDFAISSGVGYFRIDVDYSHDDTFDQDVLIKRIDNPFSVYGDPYDRGADSANWNSAFIVEPCPLEKFKREWKGAEEADWQHSGYEQLPLPWFDADHVLKAEWWRRDEVEHKLYQLTDKTIVRESDFDDESKDLFEGEGIKIERERMVKGYVVKHYVLTGAEVLEENEWPGRYIPIVPVYGEELNIDGERHTRSLIRDAKDAQRMYNYHRSATTELVALAPKTPFIGPREAFEGKDARKWASANTENYSYIGYEGETPPQRQPFASIPAGALQESLSANDDMKAIMGLFDASLGARSNETSGKAIEARDRQGDVGTFHFLDNLNRAIRHGGKIVVDLIPHVYSQRQIIRTLGLDGTEEDVPLGERVEEDKAKGVKAVYDLTVGKYDVVTSTGPSYTTRRQEAAEQMMQLLRYFPQAAPVIGDLLVKNLDWPGAEEIAERLKALVPGLGDDDEDPRLAMAMQTIEQLKQALAEAQDDKAREDMKLALEKFDKGIKAYDAESKRLTAEGNVVKAVTESGRNIADVIGTMDPPGPYDRVQ